MKFLKEDFHLQSLINMNVSAYIYALALSVFLLAGWLAGGEIYWPCGRAFSLKIDSSLAMRRRSPQRQHQVQMGSAFLFLLFWGTMYLRRYNF